MKAKNLLIAFCIFALLTMPVMAATGEVKKVTLEDAKSENVETVESNNEEPDGFNRLLMAPVTGVNYLLDMGPLEKAILLLVGCAIGGSVIITILSFAVNNGRIGIGSIAGKYQTMIQGRDWMAFVFLGFLGFLLALALLKYVGTTSLF